MNTKPANQTSLYSGHCSTLESGCVLAIEVMALGGPKHMVHDEVTNMPTCLYYQLLLQALSVHGIT